MASTQPQRDESGNYIQAAHAGRSPQNHRTISRATRILEEVVYNPGIGFADLARTLDCPKSSAHSFIRGLMANGWLYEEKRRFYLGPAAYGLTVASGHIRAGMVTHADLLALHQQTGLAVFLGVQAGDHIINVAEAGNDPVAGFAARTNIRRTLIATAGGKALLAAQSDDDREAYLHRHRTEHPERVEQFLVEECQSIIKTGIATNLRNGGTRFAIATTIRGQTGRAMASITLVGPTADVKPRLRKLSETLLRQVEAWARRATKPREAI